MMRRDRHVVLVLRTTNKSNEKCDERESKSTVELITLGAGGGDTTLVGGIGRGFVFVWRRNGVCRLCK